MSSSSVFEERDEPSALIFIGLLVGSIVAHGVLMVLMPNHPPERLANKRVEMEFYEEKKPDPPKVEEPPKEEPKIEVPKVQPKLVVKVDAPKPPEDVPPPPNQEAKEVPQEPVPIVIGVTMDSTTATGGFAVQVGNTTYGKASKDVVDANSVKNYAAPKYAPPGSADTEPTILGEVKPDYPSEAKKNDIEGHVRLRVTIDETGLVTAVTVISGPGYGLNEAARDAVKRAKFKPAMKGGEAVGYTITYTYQFLLD
jgi:protein TonB